jgi:hypothetical protein
MLGMDPGGPADYEEILEWLDRFLQTLYKFSMKTFNHLHDARAR